MELSSSVLGTTNENDDLICVLRFSGGILGSMKQTQKSLKKLKLPETTVTNFSKWSKKNLNGRMPYWKRLRHTATPHPTWRPE